MWNHFLNLVWLFNLLKIVNCCVWHDVWHFNVEISCRIVKMLHAIKKRKSIAMKRNDLQGWIHPMPFASHVQVGLHEIRAGQSASRANLSYRWMFRVQWVFHSSSWCHTNLPILRSVFKHRSRGNPPSSDPYGVAVEGTIPAFDRLGWWNHDTFTGWFDDFLKVSFRFFQKKIEKWKWALATRDEPMKKPMQTRKQKKGIHRVFGEYPGYSIFCKGIHRVFPTRAEPVLNPWNP